MSKSVVDKKERKKLKATWVSEVTPFGDSGQKVKFNGDDGLQYEVFNKSLFEHIKVGSELDADTELRISTGQDGTQYPHWIVTQIYVDGNPISSREKRQGAQWGRQPEERASIETQVSAKIGAELLIGKIITKEDALGKATIDWCLQRLAPARNSAEPKEAEKKEVKKEKTVVTINVEPAKAEVPESFIDLVWAKEQIGKLQAKGIKAWSNSNIVSYLSNVTGKKATTVSSAISFLNKEQSEEFVVRIQEAVELL